MAKVQVPKRRYIYMGIYYSYITLRFPMLVDPIKEKC